MKDYYKILQISRSATREEIIKAFRSLAKKYHPDVNKDKNAHTVFVEINLAYETIKDDNLRKKYDIELKKFENRYKVTKYDDVDTEFEDEDLNRQKQQAKKQAEEYANMSFNDFEEIVDKLFETLNKATKKVKTASQKGCGYIFFIFGILAVIKLFMGLMGLDKVFSYPFQITAILLSFLFGYGLIKND